jgi:hypothetical protein
LKFSETSLKKEKNSRSNRNLLTNCSKKATARRKFEIFCCFNSLLSIILNHGKLILLIQISQIFGKDFKMLLALHSLS